MTMISHKKLITKEFFKKMTMIPPVEPSKQSIMFPPIELITNSAEIQAFTLICTHRELIANGQTSQNIRYATD